MKYFFNLGQIIAFIKSMKGLIEAAAKKDVQPEHVNKVIDGVVDLLKSGVIDLPNVNEDDVAVAIQNARNQFTWTKQN